MTDAEPVSLEHLLGLPVRHRGITLGHVSDVLLDDDRAPIGLAVLSIADEPGFLPWPSAELGPDEVQAPYPLALLSETELEFYRGSSRSLVDERGAGDEHAIANS
jgi:hypothetical protein